MINVLYEDDALKVLDKPPGLAVNDIPGLLAHRLDKDTSGILLVAKSEQVLDNLQAQFKARTIKKEYLALVHGEVKEAGKVTGDIGRNPKKRDNFSVLEDAREAETEYAPVKNFQFPIFNLQKIFNKKELKKLPTIHYTLYTLLSCRPKTGRTHQIRVHLKYRGYPIVSDDKYGGRKIVRLDKRWCPRMFLHARKIGFKHPTTGQWMEIESKLPEDLKNSLEILSTKQNLN